MITFIEEEKSPPVAAALRQARAVAQSPFSATQSSPTRTYKQKTETVCETL